MAIELNGSEYNAMVRLALQVLADYGFYRFPIDVYTLAKKIGINVIPYSELPAEQYEQLTAIEGTNKGFTVVSIGKDGSIAYDTYYNDVDMNAAACRYTLAHEIKHVVSGDCLKGDDKLTQADELLADYFAKCLLAPQAVIVDYKLCLPEEYVDNFGLSYQASVNWFGAVERRKYRYGAETLFDYEKEYLSRAKQALSF